MAWYDSVKNFSTNISKKTQDTMDNIGDGIDNFVNQTDAKNREKKMKEQNERNLQTDAEGFRDEEEKRLGAERTYRTQRDSTISDYVQQRGMQDAREDAVSTWNSGAVKNYESGFQQQQNKLMSEAEQQGKDAQSSYSSTIRPRLQNLMEQASNDAKNSMSLQDYQNPNNAVAAQTRQLYQDQYNQQAEATRTTGLADYGVLSALGQGAAAGAIQGPMTAGQQMALLAQGNRQASEAYAKTQQRMADLRNLGLEKGLDAGFQRSDAAYNAGLQRQRDVAGLADQMFGQDRQMDSLQSNLRGERGGYVSANLGSQQRSVAAERQAEDEILGRKRSNINSDLSRNLGVSSEDLSFSQGATERAAAQRRFQAGQEQAGQAALLQAQAAREASQKQLFGSILQTGGTVAGAMFGGPAGAAVGSQLGAVASQNQPNPVAMNYPVYAQQTPWYMQQQMPRQMNA